MIFALEGQFEDGIHTVHDEPEMALGEHYHSADLVSDFSYVRFAEAVEIGDVVRTKYDLHSVTKTGADGTDITYAAAGSMQIVDTDGDFLDELSGIPKEPSYRDYGIIAVTAALEGKDQQGVITTYTDTKLNITWFEDGMFKDGTLKTALKYDDTGTLTYVVYAPWYVEKVDGPGVVNGVSAVKAAKDEYGLIRWCGNGPVKVEGAVARGDTLYPVSGGKGSTVPDFDAATDGGPTDAELTALKNQLRNTFATVEHAGADEQLVQAQIYAKRIGIVPEPPQHINRSFKRPYQIAD